MISQPGGHRCICCGRRATRWALGRPDRRGAQRRVWLCARCPSPAQIDQAARAISWAWSDSERQCRYYGCLAQHLDSRLAVTVPECQLVSE